MKLVILFSLLFSFQVFGEDSVEILNFVPKEIISTFWRVIEKLHDQRKLTKSGTFDLMPFVRTGDYALHTVTIENINQGEACILHFNMKSKGKRDLSFNYTADLKNIALIRSPDSSSLKKVCSYKFLEKRMRTLVSSELNEDKIIVDQRASLENDSIEILDFSPKMIPLFWRLIEKLHDHNLISKTGPFDILPRVRSGQYKLQSVIVEDIDDGDACRIHFNMENAEKKHVAFEYTAEANKPGLAASKETRPLKEACSVKFLEKLTAENVVNDANREAKERISEELPAVVLPQSSVNQ